MAGDVVKDGCLDDEVGVEVGGDGLADDERLRRWQCNSALSAEMQYLKVSEK